MADHDGGSTPKPPLRADFTRPATWDDVKTVARLLDEEGTRWALIGGYAIAAHGFVRLSEDVDILVDPSPENARRWIKALARLPDGATRELLGEEDVFEREGPYEAQGWVPQLFEAALAQVPGNAALRAIAGERRARASIATRQP